MDCRVKPMKLVGQFDIFFVASEPDKTGSGVQVDHRAAVLPLKGASPAGHKADT
jgi:hypothetical protein